MDVPVGAPRRFRRLDDERDRALRPNIAVAVGVERPAQAAGRQHIGAGEAQKSERGCEDVDPRHDRRIDVAGRYGRTGLIERHERRRARGVDRKARSFEIELIGDAIGNDGERVARHHLRIYGGRIEEKSEQIVRSGCADEHADRRTGQR